jgi:hypothetical protein
MAFSESLSNKQIPRFARKDNSCQGTGPANDWPLTTETNDGF